MELTAFEDLNEKMNSIQRLISMEADDEGKSQLGLLPFLLIIERQAINAFECLTKYQSYEAWMVFRPAIEAALLVGKFIDNPNNAELWKNKVEYRKNNDKRSLKRYYQEFEKGGLIPKSFKYGKELRELLTKINDEFMHVNFSYFERMYDLELVDENTGYLNISYNDKDVLKHKAYLYSFLNAYQILIQCLGNAFLYKYKKYEQLKNLNKPSVRYIWEDSINEIISSRPDLEDIFYSYGLCGIEHPFV